LPGTNALAIPSVLNYGSKKFYNMDTRTVEEFIEEQLKKRIENFNMKDFLKGKKRKEYYLNLSR
jgi:hypothetical protein